MKVEGFLVNITIKWYIDLTIIKQHLDSKNEPQHPKKLMSKLSAPITMNIDSADNPGWCG